MNRFVFLFLCGFATNAFAMQIKESGGDGVISASVSGIDLNRIRVISDRISSVRHNDGEIEVLEDASKGEIYLRTKISDPISVFITTERDHTYQMLLVPKKIPSEQIFIKNEEAILEGISAEVSGADSYKESIADLIWAMRSSQEIEGYTRIKKKSQKGKKELLIAYEGDHYIGEVYRYKHGGFRKQNTKDLFKGYLAISTDKAELAKDEEAIIYIVRGI